MEIGFISPEIVTKSDNQGCEFLQCYMIYICNIQNVFITECYFFHFVSTDVAKLNIIYIKLHFNEIDQLVSWQSQWIQIFIYVYQHIITKFNQEVHIIFRLHTLPDVMNVIIISFLLMFACINVLDAHTNSMTKLGLFEWHF